MATNSTQIKRLASPSNPAIGSIAGQGSRAIVIPIIPDPPESWEAHEKAKWKSDWDRWRTQLQAQFPSP